MKKYERVKAQVSKDAFAHNFEEMHKNVKEGTKIIAVIKADGYCHCARAIARLIQDYDYIWGFATATAEEALELRHAGITKPVLILGLVFEEYYEELAANDIRVPIEGNDLDVTSFLAKQAVKSSSKLHVKAIITDSYTGRTARYLAAFRGTSTVFSICYNPRVMRMLSLSYGVWAVHQPYNDSRRGYFYDALNELIKSGRITRNDMVTYLSGSFGEGGGTSFLEINNVGKVLDAGSNYQLPTFKE